MINYMINNKRLSSGYFAIILLLAVSSCKKWVESPPPVDVVTEKNVYSVDATAIGVMNDIYTAMNREPFQGNGGITMYTGLSSDELTLYGATTTFNYAAYYHNALSATNNISAGSELWSLLYSIIFKCNAVVDGLSSDNANSLTAKVRQQLLGEAKFMRALFYFNLVNFFGDVPLALTSDPQINSRLARSPVTDVYERIISDLEEAQQQLNENFLDGTLLNSTSERVRPTKWAATALLARVHLYIGEYAKAEAESSEIINNTSVFGPLPVLNDVFIKNSTEAIWQLQPTDAGFNTKEAQALVLNASGPNEFSNPIYLSNNLLASFESGDQRKVNGNWINSVVLDTTEYFFAFKYKLNLSDPSVTSSDNMNEYFMVLRLSEQYLIRAEARAHLENIEGAQEDLNVIRNRAGLSNTTAADQQTLLDAILHERQVELFSEWGHRWFDLKRTGNVDEIMSVITPQKAGGAPWQSYQAKYPLPLDDIQKDQNLVQNPGY